MVYSIMKYIDAKRFIVKKQNGLCRFCKEEFNSSDTIISAGQINKKYYHKKCAERLNIVWKV